MNNITLAVVGTRKFNTDEYKNIIYKIITLCLSKYNFNVIHFVSGGALGPDSIGECWADEHNISKTIYKPDWKKYGKKAGFIRNECIINSCDVCFIFWDGESHGTNHDIQLCKKLHKPMMLWMPSMGNNFTFNYNEEQQDSMIITPYLPFDIK